MREQSLFAIFEVMVVVIELFAVYIYQSGCFQCKNISGWKRVMAYFAFGLVLTYFSVFYPSMILLPIVTFIGVFATFTLLYKGNILSHFFVTLLFLLFVIAMEFVVSGVYSSVLGIMLIKLHSYGAERIWVTLTAKILTLAVIKVVTIIMEKHKESLPNKMWRIIPLLLCQMVLIVIMTDSFISTYQNSGMLTTIAAFEIIGVIFVNVVIFWYYDNLIVTHELKHSGEIITMQLENQMKYYDMVQSQQDSFFGIEHDIKKHISVLEQLIGSGHKTEASKYIASFTDSISENMSPVFTPHPVISTILSNCRLRANKESVKVKFDISIPRKLGVNDIDLTIILGNTIDNALEALSKVPDGKERRLSISLKQSDYFLFYEIINSFEPGNRKKDAHNKARHGYGLKNIEMAVEKYDGELIIKEDVSKFTVAVIINSPLQV